MKTHIGVAAVAAMGLAGFSEEMIPTPNGPVSLERVSAYFCESSERAAELVSRLASVEGYESEALCAFGERLVAIPGRLAPLAPTLVQTFREGRWEVTYVVVPLPRDLAQENADEM